jgi:predicted nucleic acid-binding protein
VILVLDASPLITLARIGSLDLLRQLAGQIIIPDAVYAESVSLAQCRPGSIEIAQASWITHRTVVNRVRVEQLHTRIGLGEAEAIILAGEIGFDAIVVLDDATARRIAEQEGCRVVGLLGLLVMAKQRGLLAAVRPLLDAMRSSGFFVSDDLYTIILRQGAEE